MPQLPSASRVADAGSDSDRNLEKDRRLPVPTKVIASAQSKSEVAGEEEKSYHGNLSEEERYKDVKSIKELFGVSSAHAERIIDLKSELGIAANSGKDVSKILDGFVNELRSINAPGGLPDRPKREFQPRENIIDYIRSDEGFGPWLAMGTLTRPFIRRTSPKAYMALANFLRSNDLPSDLNIPTKSEAVASEAESFRQQPDARDRARAASRTSKRLHWMLTKS